MRSKCEELVWYTRASEAGTRALQQRSKQLRLASEDAGKGVQYVYDVVMGMDMGIGRKA